MIVATQRRDFTRANAAGELDGSFEFPDADSIDIAAKARCPDCGHVGLQFRGFMSRRPLSIRTFWICDECGSEQEV